MKSKSRKTSGKSYQVTLSTAVALAMGVSSGIATANTQAEATDLETLSVGLPAEYIDEALSATAGESHLMVASRTFGLETARTKSGKVVPPKRKAPPKKKPPKKKPPIKKK